MAKMASISVHLGMLAFFFSDNNDFFTTNLLFHCLFTMNANPNEAAA
jgi:hypothetical protein